MIVPPTRMPTHSGSVHPTTSPRPSTASPLAAGLIAAATGILVRVGREDLARQPESSTIALVGRAAVDPTLYARDDILRAMVAHAGPWSWIMGAGQMAMGTGLAQAALVLLLTVWLVAGLQRLFRAVGGPALLLPVVALLVLFGPATRLGLAPYPATFRPELVAVAALIWCYAALIEGRAVPAGVYLVIAAVSAPCIAAPGALGLLLALPFAGGLGRQGWLVGLLGLGVCLLPTAGVLASPEGSGAASRLDEVVRHGYLFRMPERFTLEAPTPLPAVLLLVTALTGMAGGVLLARRRQWAVPPLALLLSAGLLVGCSAVLYAPERQVTPPTSLIPYAWQLTSMVAVLGALAGPLGIAGARALFNDRDRSSGQVVLGVALFAGLVHLLPLVSWRRSDVLLLVLVVTGWALSRRYHSLRPTAMLYAAGGLAGLALLATGGRSTKAASAASSLHTWAKDSTAPGSLFIIPPGLHDFRVGAERPVFVDFALFPGSIPSLVPEWRRRLELVSAPDRLALAARGWPGVPLWDRAFANRNTPSRIADLLEVTGADYLVWDREGLQASPFVPIPREPDERVRLAYHDGRFEVYQRQGHRE